MFKVDYNAVLNLEGETDFVGYAANDTDARDGYLVSMASRCELSVGQEGIAILLDTVLRRERRTVGRCRLVDRRWPPSGGDTTNPRDIICTTFRSLRVRCRSAVAQWAIDNDLRIKFERITYTNYALRSTVLGAHVEQKGSLVDSDKLHFGLHTRKASLP